MFWGMKSKSSMVKWTNITQIAWNVEITFQLLYEETNKEVNKMANWRRIWQQSVNKQTWKSCGKIQGSYFKIQDPHKSGKLCARWNVLYGQSLGKDSHQCRHLTKWTLVQHYSTIWRLILTFLYALSFIWLHTDSKRLSFPCPWQEGIWRVIV